MAWYEELFASEDPARFERYQESEASRQQVDFVIEKLGLTPGMRILDLCCGQGRHLIDLARRGYEVVGVDLSDYMLGNCGEAAAEAGVEVNLIRADMRELSFDNEFDAAISMFTSFGYFESDDEDQKVITAVGRALKPGGVFLLDLINRDWMMRNFRFRDWSENSKGDITVSSAQFDSATGRTSDYELTIHPDGSRTEHRFSISVYTQNEVARMLKAAGLAVESVFGGFDGSELTMDARRMATIARKAI